MADRFEPFTLTHLLAVLVCGGAMVGAVVLGRRLRGAGEAGRRREHGFVMAWAWFIVIWQIAANAWWLGVNFRLDVSLPLHICDLVAWAAAFAFLTPRRWIRTVLYFWGIGLSTQAFFTPTLNEGPATVQFWLFWIGHTQIVGSAVYDVAVRGYRPMLRDFLAITAISLVYLGVVLTFDIAFGVNYGYVGASNPSQPTLIDALGPWPLRVLWIVILTDAVFALAWLIWPACARLGAAVGRRTDRRHEPPPGGER